MKESFISIMKIIDMELFVVAIGTNFLEDKRSDDMELKWQ